MTLSVPTIVLAFRQFFQTMESKVGRELCLKQIYKYHNGTKGCNCTRNEMERKKMWKDLGKRDGNCGVKGGGRTGQDKVKEKLITIPATPDGGKSSRWSSKKNL